MAECLLQKQKGEAGSPLLLKCVDKCCLEQSEIHLKIHCHGYWRAILFAGFKQPGLYPLNSFLIQAHAQTADNPDIAWTSVRTDDRCQNHCTLIFCFAGFFR